MSTGRPAQGLRALIVDDAPEIRRVLERALAADGFVVEEASDGERALAAARARPPDIVVLDLGLPSMDGIEVCRRLRAFSDAYVIILTSRDEEIDTLVGLAAGADDYVRKPASGRQIVARARAMLRRPRGSRIEGDPGAETVRRIGDLEIDTGAREVTISGGVVGLTRIEFDLLDALTATPRVVVSRTALLEGIWGANWYGDDHVVDVHISNLRRKIGAGYIRTVRGVGYRMGDGT
jgi:DNA-binding response OmpR family regulator